MVYWWGCDGLLVGMWWFIGGDVVIERRGCACLLVGM